MFVEQLSFTAFSQLLRHVLYFLLFNWSNHEDFITLLDIVAMRSKQAADRRRPGESCSHKGIEFTSYQRVKRLIIPVIQPDVT